MLTEVGVTEKKTHSSSLEDDEAERVRGVLGKGATRPAGEKQKKTSEPKIDLSAASKPGDIAKMLLARKQQAEGAKSPVAGKAAPVAAPVPVVTAAAPAAPVAAKPAPSIAPPRKTVLPQARAAAPITAPAPPPSTPAIASKTPLRPVVGTRPAGAPTPEARPAISGSVPATPVVVKRSAVPAAPTAPVAAAPAAEAPVAETSTPEPQASAPAVQPKRMVMPQTGPRPSYLAPPGTPAGAAGTPQRGQPIFQRPRPGAPGAPGSGPRSPLSPGFSPHSAPATVSV